MVRNYILIQVIVHMYHNLLSSQIIMLVQGPTFQQGEPHIRYLIEIQKDFYAFFGGHNLLIFNNL